MGHFQLQWAYDPQSLPFPITAHKNKLRTGVLYYNINKERTMDHENQN